MGITTVDADVSAVCESAIDQLRAAGVEVIELDDIWDTHPFKAWIVFGLRLARERRAIFGARRNGKN